MLTIIWDTVAHPSKLLTLYIYIIMTIKYILKLHVDPRVYTITTTIGHKSRYTNGSSAPAE